MRKPSYTPGTEVRYSDGKGPRFETRTVRSNISTRTHPKAEAQPHGLPEGQKRGNPKPLPKKRTTVTFA